MRDLALEILLCLGLLVPGEALFPPADVLAAARELPRASKERVIAFAVERGRFFPTLETPAWESFDGVYVILYRRARLGRG
jgi:hypothetical protein